MKHGQKPTREQKITLTKNGLDSYDFYMIQTVGKGWLFQSKSDPDKLIVCYSDRKGIFAKDGVTPLSDDT